MKAVFFRATKAEDKGVALKQAIADSASPDRFEVAPEHFATVPRAPFAYWASERTRLAFRNFPRLQNDGRVAKQGLATADDFRFARLWTEVPVTDATVRWSPFAKGGEFSPFYSDVHLVVNWAQDGMELRAAADQRDHNHSDSHTTQLVSRPGRVQNTSFYGRAGLTWPRRTQAGLSLRALPRGCIFADKGPAIFVDTDDSVELLALLAVANSRPFAELVELQMAFGSYEVGVIQNTPVPRIEDGDRGCLGRLALEAWTLTRSVAMQAETSHAFVGPALLQTRGKSLAARSTVWAKHLEGVRARLVEIETDIDRICSGLYGLSDEDESRIRRSSPDDATAKGATLFDDGRIDEPTTRESDLASQVAALLSWTVGVAFGRFDVQCGSLHQTAGSEAWPFEPLVWPPGMLTASDSGHRVDLPQDDYELDSPADGILDDDPGVESDILAVSRRVIESVFDDPATCWDEAAGVLSVPDLRFWYAREFFDVHIKQYRMSRRQAPIYWQIATPTASYSAWLYYHRFSRDTLFRLLNEHVVPKLQHEEGKLANLAKEAGPRPSQRQRRAIASQDAFVNELRALRAEVARVAPLWHPNLNDGVIINFAPLWRLVPQNRSWQKECQKVWDGLVDGRYDWAHLAMHLWPERVVSRCVDDRSLAIAHDLEEVFWVEDEDGKWKQRTVSADVIKRLVRERTSAAVEAAVEDLLNAPAPQPVGRRIRRNRGTGGGA